MVAASLAYFICAVAFLTGIAIFAYVFNDRSGKLDAYTTRIGIAAAFSFWALAWAFAYLGGI